MSHRGSVGTEGQQVLPGAAAEAAVVSRVGGSCPAVVVMLRSLGQGLGGKNHHRVPVGHQPMKEMSSFQPLQQLTWGQNRVQHGWGTPEECSRCAHIPACSHPSECPTKHSSCTQIESEHLLSAYYIQVPDLIPNPSVCTLDPCPHPNP